MKYYHPYQCCDCKIKHEILYMVDTMLQEVMVFILVDKISDYFVFSRIYSQEVSGEFVEGLYAKILHR